MLILIPRQWIRLDLKENRLNRYNTSCIKQHTILTIIKRGIFTTMGYGMTSRRKYENVKIKVKQRWELATGHREHRDTVMDNRPKRERTRSAVDKTWRRDYDMQIADVTQLVEQRFCKPPVGGSIPSIGPPRWCNGSTGDFGSLCLGSNPSLGIRRLTFELRVWPHRITASTYPFHG